MLKDPNRFKKASIYFMIVLIPSLIINTCIYYYQKDKIMDSHRSEAAFMINVHKNQIDSLIQDTKARLESMALVLEEETDRDKIQRVLTQAHDQEPRFSGLYFVHKNGDISAGSSQLMKTVNLKHRAFFKSALATKQTTVSDAYFGNITGDYIVSICTPILDENGEVANLLVAALKVDYLQNIINVISPRLNIKVVDDSNHVLFASSNENEASKIEPVRVYLDQISWRLEGTPDSEMSRDHVKDIMIYMLITFGILNIIFILIQNFLLKRKAQIEQSQMDAQKVELVGMLAASTAHEIRNPLTGVKGFIQLLQEKYQDSEDQFYFSVIDKEIQRINEIVSEFLVLGKPTAHHHADHDLNAIVLELSPLLGSEANLYNAEMDIRLYKEPLLINCTKDHIKQVLLNLAKNSLEAIEKNEGKLTIEVQKQGDFAVIKVTDTGKGIPEDVISKIFHPFFTMKDTGTGLGLVVCKRIISMYKGTIAIDSELNKGTEVTITLPLSEKE
ncbi:ATP-binding protein [Metabacillus idriensis]|uniref:ATP-binding protein n=1 Tax=Metabacillus idriensis TaxID=324768 RepID=UPI00281474D6|nr:ATP-binding protein [Metabacillus idriensis]MDR0136975.1 ATP-binding protein [Metabacillus idriensis]